MSFHWTGSVYLHTWVGRLIDLLPFLPVACHSVVTFRIEEASAPPSPAGELRSFCPALEAIARPGTTAHLFGEVCASSVHPKLPSFLRGLGF